jgi:hypothetical protein
VLPSTVKVYTADNIPGYAMSNATKKNQNVFSARNRGGSVMAMRPPLNLSYGRR